MLSCFCMCTEVFLSFTIYLPICDIPVVGLVDKMLATLCQIFIGYPL